MPYLVLDNSAPQDPTADEIVPLEEYERRYIKRVLEQTGWVIKGPQGAAVLLDMPPSTLQGRLKKLGISRPRGVI